MKQKKSRIPVLLIPFYVFTLIFVVAPLIYLLILSFCTRAEIWGVLPEFTVKNYLDILNPVYIETFLKSLKLSGVTTLLTALIGYPYGYYMAKLSEKWKRRMMVLLLIPFFTNSLIRLYGWMTFLRAGGPLSQLLIVTGIAERPPKLLYTYPAVILGMVYMLLPFMIFMVYSSGEKLDFNLIEAARDLGASPLQAFFTVTWKLTLPGLLAGVVLTFVPSMGLFYIADLLGGSKVVLVGSLIQEQLLKTHNWPLAGALSVVLMILTTLLIFICRAAARSSRGEELL